MTPPEFPQQSPQPQATDPVASGDHLSLKELRTRLQPEAFSLGHLHYSHLAHLAHLSHPNTDQSAAGYRG